MERLLDKLVRFPAQSFGQTDKGIQRDIVFAAFHSTDKRPVHVSSLGEPLLRQTEFLTKLADILSESLAVCVCHAPQVWRKSVWTNIDYNTISVARRCLRQNVCWSYKRLK